MTTRASETNKSDTSIPSHHANLAAIPVADNTAFTDGSSDIPIVRQIYFGTGGTAVLKMVNGMSATYKNIPNGGTITGQFKHLQNTGSTGVADMVLRW